MQMVVNRQRGPDSKSVEMGWNEQWDTYIPIPPMDEVLNFPPVRTENQVFETPRKEFLLFFL